MKKYLFTAVLINIAANVFACTNFLITKGASANGSTMITYAADSHVLYGELYLRPAGVYAPGSSLKVYEWDSGKFLGIIDQTAETYSVVGNMNEFGLAIGETTFGGRRELVDSTGIIDYGSLIYLALQRSKDAREAIKNMADLVARYGYCSSGESFSICDPNEVWIMEMIGKGINPEKDPNGNPINKNKGAVWVAVKIPDGYVCAHANQARIQQFKLSDGVKSISSKEMSKIFNPSTEVVYSYDVIDIARRFGFYDG